MISLRSFEAIKDGIAYFPHLACQAIYNQLDDGRRSGHWTGRRIGRPSGHRAI